MNAYQDLLKRIKKDTSVKERQKLHLETLENLLEIMKDKEDEGFDSRLDELFNILKEIHDKDKQDFKTYHKTFNALKKYVKDRWGFVPRGTVVGEYMAMGVGFGLAIGAAFTAINTAFIAIGLPIGIAVGLSLGSHKERELEKEGKLY